MNTAKIAALYTAANYDLIVRYANSGSDVSETFAWALHRAVRYDDCLPATDPSQPARYHIAICDGQKRVSVDEIGDKRYGLADACVPARVFDWALSLLPAEDDRLYKDDWMVSLHAHYQKGTGNKSEHLMRLADSAHFGDLLRGILAYQRKRRKYLKKTLKQLEVYHQQLAAKAQAEELAKRKAGMWMGAEKALITAPRVDEPGVPFMGDTSLTYEQRQALDLRYYAVYEHMGDGMSKAFPVGTGIALKPVKRSRELVDGAVYVWQWSANGQPQMTVLGRLDMSAKARGHFPLRSDDTGKLASYCWAAWENEDVKIYRVTHYTTRNGAPAQMQAQTQPARQQPAKRRQRRELAHAA